MENYKIKLTWITDFKEYKYNASSQQSKTSKPIKLCSEYLALIGLWGSTSNGFAGSLLASEFRGEFNVFFSPDTLDMEVLPSENKQFSEKNQKVSSKPNFSFLWKYTCQRCTWKLQ